MSLVVEETKKVELIPAGVHMAVCHAIIDIGEQYSEKFDKWNRKVIVIWELPNCKGTDKDGNEFTRKVSKEYSAFLGEKTNLEKDLNAWRGRPFTSEERKGFNLLNLLGIGCQMQIIHKEKEKGSFAEIGGIMALPAGMTIQYVDEPYGFDMDTEESWESLKKMPAWILDKVKKSSQYQNSLLQLYVDANIAKPSEENGGMVTVENQEIPWN